MSYSLESATSTSLSIGVNFSDPINISPDVREPDLMQIKVVNPSLIIDAAFLDPLDVELSTFVFKVVPQNTEELTELLETIAEAMAATVVTLSIGQIILLCILGKAINAIWILINVL